jgi:tRNA(Ile)-lysidine synthase
MRAARLPTLALPRDGAPLLAAFSGGLDSTVLLHLLASQPALRAGGLRAIHVDHGLHPDSARWADHCRTACAKLGVALDVARVEVVHGGEGPEAAARTARHAAFADALRQGEVLVLAHHRDDQAETFLLRALRASGTDALASMRPWRSHGRGWLWRPLLDTPRAALLAHAREHRLDWIEDPSNASTEPDRNFLRHRVLPLLRERWPHADAAFARCAGLAAEAAALLELEDRQALAMAAGDGAHVLEAAGLLALPAARRARALRRWLAGLGLPPLPASGIAAVERDLLPAAPDAEPAFAWSGAIVRAWRGWLHAGWIAPPLPGDWDVRWNGLAPLPLPTGDWLRLEPATGFDRTVSVRARRGGERIRLPGRSHSHALKHVLQERGVAPWERERLPLLADENGEVLAAGDAILSAAFAQWLHDTGARLVWQRAPRMPEGGRAAG